jgi:hypothetical protein
MIVPVIDVVANGVKPFDRISELMKGNQLSEFGLEECKIKWISEERAVRM